MLVLFVELYIWKEITVTIWILCLTNIIAQLGKEPRHPVNCWLFKRGITESGQLFRWSCDGENLCLKILQCLATEAAWSPLFISILDIHLIYKFTDTWNWGKPLTFVKYFWLMICTRRSQCKQETFSLMTPDQSRCMQIPYQADLGLTFQLCYLMQCVWIWACFYYH